MTSIGDLNQRVRLDRLIADDDGRGGQTEAWYQVVELWARVLPTGGTEKLMNGSLTGVDAWKVTIRWRPGLDGTSYRFVWMGRVLNIRSIADPDGRREWLLAYCESGVAGGLPVTPTYPSPPVPVPPGTPAPEPEPETPAPAGWTREQAIAAIKAAAPGDTLNLTGINLGDMGTIKPRSGLTLIGGTLSSVVWNKADGLTWQDYTLRQAVRTDAKARAIRAVGGAVELKNGVHFGADNNGVTQGRAISLEGGEHIVRGGHFTGGFGSITTAFGARIEIRDTTHIGYRTTAVNGVPASNSIVENLVATAPQPVDYGGKGDHGEAVHFWTSGADISGLILRNVTFRQDAGYPTMGFYFDVNGSATRFSDTLIDTLFVSSGHSLGLLLESVHGEVRNAAMEWTRRGVRGDDPRDTPKIHVTTGSQIHLGAGINMDDVIVRDGGMLV